MKIIQAIKDTSSLCSLALAAAIMAPAANATGTINLASQDGAINITGEFVGMENDTFIIRTALGELTLSADRVRCTGAACPNHEKRQADVSFAGSETIGVGVMPLLLDGYAEQLDADQTIEDIDTRSVYNGTEIVSSFVGGGGFGDELNSYRVHSTNSVQGFRYLQDKTAEFAMSSRRITPKEAADLSAAGAGDMLSPSQEHIVAFDSLIIITHPDNPVRAISMEDLASVYMGRITNWSQLGGADKPIQVVARQSDAGTRTIFADRVFNGPNIVVGSARIAQNSTDMADFIATNEGAIGYTGLAFQRDTKALNIINECGIETTPDGFSVRTEEYALQRRLYLYNRAELDAKPAKDFLEYALSPEADKLITKAGFVDYSVARRSQQIDGPRANQLRAAGLPNSQRPFVSSMLQELDNYDQLSTTFRFRFGSSLLDERALVDMERLTSYLEEQPRGTKIVLAGFTDSIGSFANNRRLSAGRADQVRAALLDFAGDRISGLDISIQAHGELAPTACNISEKGRAINRRVEVWIEADAGKIGT